MLQLLNGRISFDSSSFPEYFISFTRVDGKGEEESINPTGLGRPVVLFPGIDYGWEEAQERSVSTREEMTHKVLNRRLPGGDENP